MSTTRSTDDGSVLRTIVILVFVLLAIPLVMMVVMMPVMGLWGWGHMWNGGMWNGTGTTWMWLIMTAVPLLVLVAVGYLLYSALSQPGSKGTDPALEELRAAYARGDLSDEEFDKRRERLKREE